MLSTVSAFNWNDDIVSYYKLDNNNFSDELGVNDGTNDGTTNTSGILVDGRLFDGLANSIQLPTATYGYAATQELTVNAWGNTSNIDGIRTLINFNGIGGSAFPSFTMNMLGDGTFQVGAWDQASPEGSTGNRTDSITNGYNDNNWHMYTLTVDTSIDNISLYVDGVYQNSSVFSGDLYEGTNTNWIGSEHDTKNWWNGSIDEIGIWNRGLNPTDIRDLYNFGNALDYDNTTIIIDSTVTLHSPINDTTISDVGTNFTAIFNISGSNLSNYVWKNGTYYVWKNGVEINITTVGLSGNETSYTQFIDNFTLADYKWNVYGCYGNATYNNCTWSSDGNYTFVVGASIISDTYDNESYETYTNFFEVNATLLSGVIIQAAYLYYDDTRYVGTVTELGDDNYSMSTTIDTPLLSGGVENKTFYWSFIYTSPVQKTQNTTTKNQTVMPIFFGPCNATYTIHAIDMGIKEEGTFIDLTGTLEFAANYWLGSGGIYRELTFSDLNENLSSFDFCISPTDKTFNIDDIISYTRTGYERRDAFLNNAELSNNTMNLSLYLALTNATDIFTITVQDQASKAVSGAFVNIQRWDIGTNNFYTVAVVKTTSDGTGIVNLRLNDAYYRYQVYYNGVLYLTTDPVKEAGTSRILEINLEEANPYDKFDDIEYSLTYDNETNISVFTYADTTGAVATGCLKVLKMQGNGTTEVYFSCVASSSGTLSYQITDDGTYIIRAIFKLGSEYDNVEKVVDEIIRQGVGERFSLIGAFGQVISLFVIGTAAMFGVAIGSIPLGLGALAGALVLVNLLGWLNISSSVLYGIISIIVLIVFNLRRNR